MKTKIIFSFMFLVFISLSSFSQAEDPEKVFNLSGNKEKLDVYMSEHDWKNVEGGKDEDGEEYFLYRKKSFGKGYVYIAAYPNKFVHYQKFDSEKKPYSVIMTYDDFIHTPEGKTHDNLSIENPNTLIKNISILDPDNNKNENKFYGIVPNHESMKRE